MKVRELIEKLSKYPEDLDVVYWSGYEDSIDSITKVSTLIVEKVNQEDTEYRIRVDGIQVVELGIN